MARPLIDYQSPHSCPKCGGQPEIRLTMYGRAKYVICGVCGWEGNTRNIEISADGALWHWNNKTKEDTFFENSVIMK